MEPFKRDSLEYMAGNLQACITDLRQAQAMLAKSPDPDYRDAMKTEIEQCQFEVSVLSSQIADEVSKIETATE